MLCHDVFPYIMFPVGNILGIDIRAADAEYAILVMKLQRLLFASLPDGTHITDSICEE